MNRNTASDVTMPDKRRHMMAWSTPLRLALVMALLLGLGYPLLVSALGGWLMPHQATGSLLMDKQGRVVGSTLVGQQFIDPAYFIGRPSAAEYDAFGVSGSNLGPDNPALAERVQADASTIATRDGVAPGEIPVELLAASGSGIDPHITPEGAASQVPRVAQARELATATVNTLINNATEYGGILGQPAVNVLRLNLALDELTGSPGNLEE
ncbi:K+-transporting ATPase ATPase C chain [Onishia taeanensis]|uniref:Potassium-transporting ATPase KdpC subunit n=1 Tax=Onishia taeanensis TaxID=284577 RepID=A0A328XIU3_9GAMM|nr:potassium-transporting ATPase subunit KdpC [Halomonas taeanensis]RAR59510.1 K+-transporting ATPase ATPase C chain [Halomonas taeanensis]